MKKTDFGLLFLAPVEVEKPWGGKTFHHKIIGEDWLASTNPECINKIRDPEINLDKYLRDNPTFLGKNFTDLPFICKVLFTSTKLSVQTHPAKDEAWFILDIASKCTDPFIYLGFNAVYDRNTVQKSITDGTIEKLLKKVPVKIGDFYAVPSGTIHAIGGGITVFEPQQNSNKTLRFYDYGSSRELHIDEALDVATLSPAKTSFSSFPDYLSLECSCETFDIDFSSFNFERWVIHHSDCSHYPALPPSYSFEAEDVCTHLYFTHADVTAFINDIPVWAGASILVPAGMKCTVEGPCTFFRTMPK